MAKGRPRSRVLPPLPSEVTAAATAADDPDGELDPAPDTAEDTAEVPVAEVAKPAPATVSPSRPARKTATGTPRTQARRTPLAAAGATAAATAAATDDATVPGVASPATQVPTQIRRPVRQVAAAADPEQTTDTEARSRSAHLRLVHIDPWSVMKTSFLLSIALGIISVVAVGIIWGVLGAAGVWDSVNSTVQQTVGSDTGTPFDIRHYVGTSRAIGFTMIASVIDVILITAIATLGAFIYNLAATLIGGVEVTFSEDR